MCMPNSVTAGTRPLRYDREAEDAWLDALGLARLSPRWAKIEIFGGLAGATLGIRLLPVDGLAAWAGAALMILGIYLALAGHRSHLYQAMNRQDALLARMLRAPGPANRDSI